MHNYRVPTFVYTYRSCKAMYLNECESVEIVTSIYKGNLMHHGRSDTTTLTVIIHKVLIYLPNVHEMIQMRGSLK